MGIRGEVFSTKITCEGRTYFFNVKENRVGDYFLNIVESKPAEDSGFERRSIVVFKDDMRKFLKALDLALTSMDKAEKEAPKSRKRPARHAEARDGETGDRRREPRTAAQVEGEAKPSERRRTADDDKPKRKAVIRTVKPGVKPVPHPAPGSSPREAKGEAPRKRIVVRAKKEE